VADEVLNRVLILVAILFTANHWIAAWVMTRAYLSDRHNRLLQVSTIRGLVRAIGVSVSLIAWVDIINDFAWFGREGVIWIVFFIIIGVALPSIYFIYLYRADKFGE
jgi:hypothetical protein